MAKHEPDGDDALTPQYADATSQELAKGRMTRSREAFEDARVLGLHCRWTGCVRRLADACDHAVDAVLLLRGLRDATASPLCGDEAAREIENAQIAPVLAARFVDLAQHRMEMDAAAAPAVYQRDDVLPLFEFAAEFLDYVGGVVGE